MFGFGEQAWEVSTCVCKASVGGDMKGDEIKVADAALEGTTAFLLSTCSPHSHPIARVHALGSFDAEVIPRTYPKI